MTKKKELPPGFLAQNKADPAANRAARRRLAENRCTPQQELFCYEYMKDMRVVPAFLRAGFSKKTAHVNAYKTFHKPWVQAKIAELFEERKQQAKVTAEKVISSIHQIADEAWADGDKQSALRGFEMLGKHLGLFITKTDHKVAISANDKVLDKQIENLIRLGQAAEPKEGDKDDTQKEPNT